MVIRPALSFVAGCILSCLAVNGSADDFPPIVNNERDQNAVPMAAATAASTMQLPPGFRATLFAAEPDVQNPIGMAWDARGRLWIAENYTYSDRTQRFDLSHRDRVLIFEDKDNDGRSDGRKIFTDQVQMLTSVEIGHGGVWLLCPPQLLFVPDANGDDQPDGPAQVVLDGFDVAQDNYHNFANGLRWGPDGWLYGRCGHSCPGKLGTPGTPSQLRVPIDGGVWRYHPQHKTVEVLCHGTTNPWGHDWDEYGELFFINTVIGHLWHMMPGAHLKESFGESMNPDVYQRLDMIADHYHFDTKGNWSDSRQGQANDFGGGHAHIGAAIYNGAVWPSAYRGKLMTINMHGQRINVERLERRGAGYIGLHEPDFMLAKDPFFRGLDLRVAPDGNMLVIDWSDIGECHEATGVHRTSGRIYKVIYDGAREQSTAVNPVVQRLQNAWQAYKIGALTQDSMRPMLTEQDEHLRVWGIRLLTDRWPLDTIVGPKTDAVYPPDPDSIATFVRMAREDKSGLVKLVLASVLQRLPIDRRPELAKELVQHREFADDRDLPLLVWYGLIPLGSKQPSALVDIARVSQWPKLNRWIARSLATRSAQSPESLEKLLQVATQQAEDFQQNTLLGLSDAFHGWRQAPQPKAWKEFARTPGALRASDELRKLNSLFGDGQALDEILAIVRDNKAEMQTRQRALETLIAARPANLRSVCESLMDVRILNATAMRGLTLYDDPAIGRMLTQKFRRFQPDDRPAVLEALVSRRSYAIELLKGMAQKNSTIGPGELTAFHARQIRSLNDEDLSQQLVEVWGQLRETSADRRALIEKLKGQLTADTLAKADRSAGRQLYNKSCSQCHQLFGQGKKIGPDLTGAQRASLDYLLENVVDPSAVVGKDYRMSKVLTVDGRVLSGLLVSRTDKSLVVQTQSTLETLSAEDVEQVQATTLSAMPEGLLETLGPNQVRDLIAYLMTPTQVGL